VLQAQTQERVGSVEVALDITHTWIGDLRVVLTSPAGTRP
jgi:subtilisin-like proprotein convertase family protein